jgi:poly(A) polymerase
MTSPVRQNIPFSPRRLDRRAVDIVRQLQQAGFEAYLVGGCVRDQLLGLRPKDYDIATSARPNQVKRLFRRSRIIGRRFKLVHVYSGREIYEVATFRREPEAGRKRDSEIIRDDNVFGTAEEDARRRDFTVNGLFLDPSKGEIVDYVGGLGDLERKKMISIGPPDVRFQEDPVRILRLVKFMRRLQLEPGSDEIHAAQVYAQLVREAAEPRIVEEIFRLMQTGNMEGVFEDLVALDVFKILVPDVARWMAGGAGRRERLSAMFRALDGWIDEGGDPGYGFRLAVLYLPMLEDELNPETRTVKVRELNKIPEVLLAVLQARARLPRVAIGRAQHILGAQKQMDPEFAAHKSSRPRKPPTSDWLLSQDYFDDALEFLRCRLEAAGRDLSIYDEWHELALSFHAK